MQDVLARLAAKVSEKNEPNASALETIYSLNLECDRLRATLAAKTEVEQTSTNEATKLRTDVATEEARISSQEASNLRT